MTGKENQYNITIKPYDKQNHEGSTIPPEFQLDEGGGSWFTYNKAGILSTAGIVIRTRATRMFAGKEKSLSLNLENKLPKEGFEEVNEGLNQIADFYNFIRESLSNQTE